LIGFGIILTSAAAAGVLRVRYPHDVSPLAGEELDEVHAF
jgi:hypothetical protein